DGDLPVADLLDPILGEEGLLGGLQDAESPVADLLEPVLGEEGVVGGLLGGLLGGGDSAPVSEIDTPNLGNLLSQDNLPFV
ncbi:MAG: hypothetical protein ACSHXZ_13475, partial [Gammaproteobacteria bacterium]